MLRTAYKQLKNLISIYFYFREKVNKITQEGKLLLNKFLQDHKYVYFYKKNLYK